VELKIFTLLDLYSICMIEKIEICQRAKKYLLDNIIEEISPSLLKMLLDLHVKLDGKILEIVNFLELKLQFDFLQKEVTYSIGDLQENSPVVLPFWPLVKVLNLENDKAESWPFHSLIANKLYINPTDNDCYRHQLKTSYKVKYLVGYDWAAISKCLPILKYIIEYYLRDYLHLNQYTTSDEINKLIKSISSLYGLGNL
jgi:hypothetical protein